MAELNNTIVRGNLRVVSQMEAQEILENGTSLANKYLEITDISDWAKASTKPSYTYNEINAGNITMGDGANYVLYRTHESWRSGYYYHTTGNEAVVFANKNASTSWIFVNAVDPTDRKDWTNLGQVPAMQIKTNSVAINKLIANGATPSYNLDVNGTANATTLYEGGTSLTSKYLEITDLADWAKASSKPSYSFSGTAVTSGGNSGTAVAAVTGYSSFSGGSGSLTGNTTASGGIPYVEASLSGTELTLTVKYLHHGHTAASLGSPSTSNCAPSGHTHSVTAAGNIS